MRARRAKAGSKPLKRGTAAGGFDRAKVERGVRLILEGIGENARRAGMADTPRRVCEFYREQLAGMWEDPGSHLRPIQGERSHDLVIVKNIRFVSMCEHHLLPFIGTVGVAYLPGGGRIVGISKIVRTVDTVARRLQMQERMTGEIADAIARELKPAGVYVVVEAEHLCMTVRGVKKPGALIVTTEARGLLRRPDRQALVASALAR